MSQTKVYSPIQAALGSFLGGPLASTIFISQNFSSMDQPQSKTNALLIGLLLTVGLVALSLNLPENFPGIIFSVATIVLTRLIVEKQQFTKEAIEESEELTFHSNWLVFGIGVLSLALMAAVLYSLIVALDIT